MALKNWKLKELFSGYIIFNGVDGQNIRIKQINNLGIHFKKWLVFGYGIDIPDAYFKTELKAILYAKSYMKYY